MSIRYHFNFRSSLAGNNVSYGVNVDTLDPNDADNVTIRVLGTGSVLYPQPGPDYITAWGKLSSAGSFSNHTLAQGGGASQPYRADLAGINTWTTGGQAFQIDLDNGEYELWFASGGATANTADGFSIFDDSKTNVVNGTGSYNALPSVAMRLWANNANITTSDWIIAPDGGVWAVTIGGTTAASDAPPVGVKDQIYNSNGTQLKHSGRVALAWGITTTAGNTMVANQNGEVIPASAWPGPGKIVRVNNGHITIFRGASALRIRNISIRKIQIPLVDATVYDHFDRITVPPAKPDVWARQPAGYEAMRLTFLGSTANLSLGGTLAPYFNIVVTGSNIRLVHNGTLLPDSLAGTQTLTVTQVDPDATNSPYTTTISVNVISSGGRTNNNNGSVEGAICTQSWLNLAYIRSVHDTWLWKGYNNEPFATDVWVDNDADLRTRLNEAKAAATGTSWHRIRLRDGGTGFAGDGGFAANFGDGGLLIEPDVGHDPAIGSTFYPFDVHGIHWRNTLIATHPSNLQIRHFRGTSPGATGILGSGKSHRVAFTGNRVGIGHQLTMDYEDDKQIVGYKVNTDGDYTDPGEIAFRSRPFLSLDHGESLYLKDNVFDGSTDAPLISSQGVRATLIIDNLIMRNGADTFAVGGLTSPTTVMKNYFADNNIHVIIANNVLAREPGYSNFTTGAHADFWQGRTPGQNASFWYANGVPEKASIAPYNNAQQYSLNQYVIGTDGRGYKYRSNTPTTGNAPPNTTYWTDEGWRVNDTCFVRESNAWYKVAAVTTGVTSGTPPSGTGNNIPDGGVTWNYYSDNVAIGAHWYVAVYGNDMIAASPQVAGGGFSRQFYIDSQAGFGILTHASIFDNTNTGLSDKGVSFTEGDLYAEYNTFAGPPGMNATADFNLGTISVKYQTSFAIIRKNITMGDVNIKDTNDNLCTAYLKDNKVIEWDVSSAVGGNNAPDTYFAGTFSQTPYMRDGNTPDTMYVVNGIDNSGGSTRLQLRSQVRAALRNIVDDKGYWPDQTIVDPPEDPPPGGPIAKRRRKRVLLGPGFLM